MVNGACRVTGGGNRVSGVAGVGPPSVGKKGGCGCPLGGGGGSWHDVKIGHLPRSVGSEKTGESGCHTP